MWVIISHNALYERHTHLAGVAHKDASLGPSWMLLDVVSHLDHLTVPCCTVAGRVEAAKTLRESGRTRVDEQRVGWFG